MSMVKREDLTGLEKLSMPGSDLAIEAGCKCTSKYNRGGRGTPCRDGWAYEISPECKITHHILIGQHEHAE